MDPRIREILKEELGPEGPKYEEGLLGRKTRGFCGDCKKVYQAPDGNFYPACMRSSDEWIDKNIANIPPDQQLLAKITVDAVEWAKWEFDWDARWYQAQALRCTAQKQAWRWGRRSGKSTVLGIKSLHLCATKPNVGANDEYTVLVVTPYEAQLDRLFEMCRQILTKSQTFKTTRDLRNPHTLEFSNNSKIIGFTAGEKTGARSTKIRGQDANAIIIDEADYLRDEDVGTILAILASHADCQLVFSSTPKGTQTRFRKACEDHRLGFKQFWLTSLESPEYTFDADYFFRSITTRHEYEHEYLALFSQAEDAIFPEEQIRASTKQYVMPLPPTENETTIVGVDWNAAANGVHAVVLGCATEPRRSVRVLDISVLQGQEFSHNKAQQMLLDIFFHWRPTLLALDRGYANAQIENLLEWALYHPEYQLDSALKHYNLGSSYKSRDPISGEEIKRPLKPLMVGFTQAILGHGGLTLPASEEKESGIIGQMQAFQLKSVGQTGRPVFTQGNEHTLTAMMIGILAWTLEIVGIDPSLTGMHGIRAIHSLKDIPKDLPIPMVSGPRVMPTSIFNLPKETRKAGRTHWDGKKSAPTKRSRGKTMRKSF
jgi:hypothetical protein